MGSRAHAVRIATIATLVIVASAAGACVGDDPATSPADPTGADGGSANGDGAPGVDGAQPGDGSGGDCTPGAKECQGDVLRTCRPDGSGLFDETTCADGCSATPTAHCKTIVPSANGIVPADLDGTGLSKIDIIANATIDSDTGAITNVRVANSDPSKREVISGIAFHQVDIPGGGGAKIGIFSFGNLTIGDGKIVVATGSNALALASAEEITVLGTLDGRGTCLNGTGGPGGGKGGTVAGVAGGAGKGTAGASNQSGAVSGGGGGGYGDDGGKSFQLGVGGTTAGGLPYGNVTLVPLLGGSGGGRGGDANSAAATTGGIGGGGGGAIQLVAVREITIGGGSAIGGINAGGCGGKGAAIPAINSAGGGGGGGSGGAILVEAPIVKLDLMGHLVVNGGAGGGGATGSGVTAQDGEPGKMTWSQTNFHGSAPGGGASCGAGGFGGASAETPSTVKGENGATGGTGNCPGGGGGGAGRIRVNTTSGAMIVVNASGIVSPRFADLNSHADPAATQGKIKLE